MKSNKAIRIILVFFVIGFISISKPVQSSAEDKSAKNVPESIEAEKLLEAGYEYDLDSVLYIKKGEKEPRLFDLNTSNMQGEFTSSEVLNQKNSDRIVNYSKRDKLRAKLIELEKDSSIEYFQPVYLYNSEAWSRSGEFDTPSDFDLTPSPSTGNHWYYELSNLRKLWQKQDCVNAGANCGGSANVTVAVIDTGLAFEDRNSAWNDVSSTKFNFDQIPDMFSGGSINLYQNAGETPNNQIDDDSNGYIDDANGFNSSNFILCYYSACTTAQSSETGHPNDDGGHGTYVTGLITSLVDNASGSVSPAHKVTIMPIKANFRKSNSFGTLELYYAIYYAIDNGADIINMSLAGSSPDGLLEEALQDARDAGVLVVAASGNNGGTVQYPAKYNSSTLAVGAVNPDNSRSSYSNYGSDLDLVAYVGQGGASNATYQSTFRCFTSNPNCYSSTDTSRYTLFSNTDAQYRAVGTSFAAPQVAAAAAIIISNNPGISLEELRLGLATSTNDINSAGQDDQTGVGVINFEKAFNFNTNVVERIVFPEYITLEPDRASWLVTANPSQTDDIFYYNIIKNISYGPYLLKPGERKSLKHTGIPQDNQGPVTVVANGLLYSTQVSRIGLSHFQMHGSNVEDLTNEYYFPEYIVNSFRNSWLIISNPSVNSTDATVTVYIGNESRGPYNIPPGEKISRLFTDLNPNNLGPVKVVSNINIDTTQINSANEAYNQIEGISSVDLVSNSYFPEYIINDFRKSWIVIGNPSTTLAANVTIDIGGDVRGPYTINPGERISKIYFDLNPANLGPVKITSDNNVYSSQVSTVNNKTYQMLGLDPLKFTTNYYYPEYIVNDFRKSWIVVGNPSSSTSANVTIEVGGVSKGPYTIPPGGRVSKIFFDLGAQNLGPVKVISDTNVYTIQVNAVYDYYYIAPGMI